MPYVMVPVPEEHVEDVMEFILRAVAAASVQAWDDESLDATYHEVDEMTRSLLAFVARAQAEGKELDAIAAARQIQMTAREVNGILSDLQTLTRETNRPPLIVARLVSEKLPNGRVTETRVLTMETEVAELVRAAERRELAEARRERESLPGGA